MNPAGAATFTFTIASFAADGTTVKDASAALGSYSTFAYPLGVVMEQYTDNTCATRTEQTYKYYYEYELCGASDQMYKVVSPSGGESGFYFYGTAGQECTGTFVRSFSFEYSTTAVKNCVTANGNFFTYKAVFADSSVTKVGVDFDVANDATCAEPQFQAAAITGACTEIVAAGSTIAYVKFYPLAAGVLADGGMSAEKSVAVFLWQPGTGACTGPGAGQWGGVYSTGCADTDKTAFNWKFCENAACPVYSSSASTSTVAATVALGAVTAAVLLA